MLKDIRKIRDYLSEQNGVADVTIENEDYDIVMSTGHSFDEDVLRSLPVTGETKEVTKRTVWFLDYVTGECILCDNPAEAQMEETVTGLGLTVPICNRHKKKIHRNHNYGRVKRNKPPRRFSR